MLRRSAVIVLCLILFQSCLTYYQRNLQYHEYFASHQYGKANESLDKNKYIQKSKNELLFLLEKGVTLQMMGKFEESNKFFEEAYIFVEDFQHSLGRDALSLITSDMARNYAGEDFERIFIHYYKAINFIMLGDLDAAMVEARRVNIKLNEINDKYKSEAKYKRDAFAHVLMGLLYEASGDENNAFIAYRNAYEIYDEDYNKFFNMGPPRQLKKDLIRLANLNGFYDSQEFYEKKFEMKYKNEERHDKELVYIWHNGLGPVKDEWSINFVIIRGTGGMVVFSNKELGLTFTFHTRSTDEYNSLGDLKVVRVAFPKYSTRKGIYTGGIVKKDSVEYKLELLENVNEIAIKSLRDRMFRELSKTLLRTALKQAAEQAARKEDEGLGAVVSVINAATEKADTRNWQTLPARIYYTRIPMDEDTATVDLITLKGAHRAIDNSTEEYVSKRLAFRFWPSITRESLILKQ